MHVRAVLTESKLPMPLFCLQMHRSNVCF